MFIIDLLKKILPNASLSFLKSCRIQWIQIFNGFPYRKYTKKHKCIFIHIPKTAGTSILTSLMGADVFRDHADFYDFKRVNKANFEHYFKFCFVRNPYDRAVSFYEYLRKGGNGHGDLYFKKLIEDKYQSFEKFVLEYLDSNKIHEHILLKPQYLFVYNHKYECQVDFVGRFENIRGDFQEICIEIGIIFDLPYMNKVDSRSYESYFSNKRVQDKIKELYLKDFELFKYSTEIRN